MHAIYDSCVGRGKVDIETRAAVSTPRVHVVRDCVRVHGFFGVAIRPRFVAAFVVRVSGHVPDRVRQRASVGWRRPSCLIHTSVRSVPNSKKDSSSIMWYAHIRIMTLYASMGKNVSTYYGRDWHYMLEEQARGHEHAFSCDHIMKSLPSIPMFTIFNQASPEQLLTYCPKITFSHTLTVFDSRLSTLFYVANNLATPPFKPLRFLSIKLIYQCYLCTKKQRVCMRALAQSPTTVAGVVCIMCSGSRITHSHMRRTTIGWRP